MKRLGIALTVLACLTTVSVAGDGDLESKLDDLSREVKELRAWKAKVERDGLLPGDTGESPLEREIQAYLETESEPVAVRVPGSLELRVSGEIRIREEFKHDLYSPSDPDGDESFEFAHMRTRLRFDLDVEDLIDAIVELQDIRRLGEEGSTTADSEGVDLKRAMIVIHDLLADGTTLELGRIVLFYGDQRLIGHLEWFDQGRTYDGFRFGWEDETCFVDLFGARIDDDLLESDDTDLLGLYGGTSSFAEGLDVEGYVILVRDLDAGFGEDGKGNTRIITFGGRGHWKHDGIDVTGEIAYQTGEVLGDDLAAFAFAVKGGYTFEDVAWSPRIGAEVDYASGNDDLDDGDNETFQTLFPTNHLHYGYADLMGWSNMWDFRIGASATPTDDIKVTLDWHHLRLAEPEGGWMNAGGGLIRSGDEDADEHLGDEIDVTVVWKATKALKVLLGWSHFLAGDFVDDTGDSSDADFGYVQVHLKF